MAALQALGVCTAASGLLYPPQATSAAGWVAARDDRVKRRHDVHVALGRGHRQRSVLSRGLVRFSA